MEGSSLKGQNRNKFKLTANSIKNTNEVFKFEVLEGKIHKQLTFEEIVNLNFRYTCAQKNVIYPEQLSTLFPVFTSYGYLKYPECSNEFTKLLSFIFKKFGVIKISNYCIPLFFFSLFYVENRSF